MGIAEMPKVELHLHLEGSIHPSTLLRIAKKNHVTLSGFDESNIHTMYKYNDFQEFLMVYMSIVKSLQSGEDFEEIAYELGMELKKENVLYAEVMISAAQYVLRGMDMKEIVQGAMAGFTRAKKNGGPSVQLAFDCGRQVGMDVAEKVLIAAIENKKNSLIAFSLGGDEEHYSLKPFAKLFAIARKEGLHIMAHAGEAGGAENVWDAIDLGCERIGHGIRSVDDPSLIAELKKKNVTLDISLTSNIRTGVVAKLENHPFKQLFDAGVRLTLNTDDPAFFSTSLTNEYHIATKYFGLGIDELVTIGRTAIDASFIPYDEKKKLLDTFQSLMHV